MVTAAIIKRRLLLGRKVMTNLDSILKSRDITLPTKVYLVKAKGSCQEELPHVRGQGQRPRVPDCDCAGTAERSYPTPPHPRPRAAAGRSNPTPEARGSGREVQPHVQGAVAVRAQEGLEELSHVEGQEGQR